MSSHWWRAYDGAVDDPKLQMLPDHLFKAWFNLCCLTSANGGTLPPIEVIAFKLRLSEAKAEKLIEELRAAILIDSDDEGRRPHNWNGRQFKSDVTDPTAADRMKRHRNKNRNATVTDTVTGDVTDGVTVTAPRDREQNTEKDNAPSGAPPRYAFESGCIRLNAKNLALWKSSFSNLDLEAELLGLTQWAETQGNNWFCAVSGALAKRNREIGIRKSAAVRGIPVQPNGKPWPEAIT